jgi:HSP20 family molecular chaperone IbpA
MRWHGLAVAAYLLVAVDSFWAPISEVKSPRSILHGLEPYADSETLDNLKILRLSTRNALSADDCLEKMDYYCGRPSHFTLKPRPLFAVQQTKAGFMLYAATPGLCKDDLSIEIVEGTEGHIIDITGGSKHNITSADARSTKQFDLVMSGQENLQLRPPRWAHEYAEFERYTRIPSRFNVTSLQAKFQDGLLILTIDPLTSK